MSSLPANLPSYELKRRLIASSDVENLFHLQVVHKEGLPELADSEFEKGKAKPSFFFPEAKELEIEIGCGKGNFSAEYGEKNPHKRILGIDHEASIAFYAANRILKKKLSNVKIIYGDAFYLFRDFLPENSVSAFHMYFPDPWPKKRHHKRRLFKGDFLKEVRRVAKPGAHFYWGTDFKGYHEEALEIGSQFDWFQILEKEAAPTQGICTNFEKKYLKEGRPIYRSLFQVQK